MKEGCMGDNFYGVPEILLCVVMNAYNKNISTPITNHLFEGFSHLFVKIFLHPNKLGAH